MANSYREQMEEKFDNFRNESERNLVEIVEVETTHGMWAFSFIRNSSPSQTSLSSICCIYRSHRSTINWQMFVQAMVHPSKVFSTVLHNLT